MTAAGDPYAPEKGDYVVPLPRSTDSLGHSLRRAYAPARETDAFAALLCRLDTLQ